MDLCCGTKTTTTTITKEMKNYPVAFVADPFVGWLACDRMHVVVGRVQIAFGLREPKRRVHLRKVGAATSRRRRTTSICTHTHTKTNKI